MQYPSNYTYMKEIESKINQTWHGTNENRLKKLIVKGAIVI